jgi:hypothetical protein
VFNSLIACDSITATIAYDTITPLQTSTLIACSLPFGVTDSLSFSLWQFNGSLPLLVSYDGQITDDARTIPVHT